MVLTRHVVATVVLLYVDPALWTLDTCSLHFGSAGVILTFLPCIRSFIFDALDILRTRLMFVEGYWCRMSRAHSEVAGGATKDWTFNTGVVDLARSASFGQTIHEARFLTEKTSHRELVEPRIHLSRSVSLHVVVGDGVGASTGRTGRSFRSLHLLIQPLDETLLTDIGDVLTSH